MPLDQELFDSAAARGEVAYIGVLTAGALDSMAAALKRIAQSAGVDVARELLSISEDISALRETADKLSGYRPA